MVEQEHGLTPAELRDGVRSGIIDSIERDVELRGGRTARLLLLAGIIGVVGALGVTLLISSHPFGHHPPWHVGVFSTIWAGLLVAGFAIVVLRVRTPSIPLDRAVFTGILGLGLAGICGAACPDPHFLEWWARTGIGNSITARGGLVISALCFGLMTAFVFGALSAFVVIDDRHCPAMRPFLPALVLFVLLAPAVGLQSIDGSPAVAAGWLAGTAAGAYLGVVAGIRGRGLVSLPRAR